MNFENETENGKLYINYPMTEALRDFEPGVCGNGEDCLCVSEQFGSYKKASAEGRRYTDFREYSFEIWREVLNVFVMRVSCLCGADAVMSYYDYRARTDPRILYHCQKKEIARGRVRVVSAFPEFLLDYFPVRFWNVCIRNRKRLMCCGKDHLRK